MEDLIIEETQATPDIKFLTNGICSISGRSFPENSFEFYEPVKKWLTDYLSKEEAQKLVINFHIIYLNSSSTMTFFELLDICEKYCSKVDIKINWYYDTENDSIEEFGEDIQEDFSSLSIDVTAEG